jgi:Tfp pilus assembly protein PilF
MITAELDAVGSKMKVKLLSTMALLIITGCSSTHTVPVSAPSESSSTQQTAPVKPTSNRDIAPTSESAKNGSQSAVDRLLDKAGQQQQQGHYSSASSSIERAIRIAPSNPQPYAELAKLKQLMGDRNSAKQLANKALSLQPSFSTRRDMRGLLDSI